MAPRKPAVWPAQHGLAAVTLIVLFGSAAYALYVVFS
jgi:hypothetical protein